MTLSTRLRERAAPIWEREFAHPFVQKLGDGTLDEERFKVWLRQDYLFLIEYGRVLGLAAARAGDLEAATPAPATRAYTDFLVRVAYEGPLAAVVAALLPCAWGYSEIASRLAARDTPPADDRYRDWIRTYTSPEFVAYAGWLRDLLDHLSDALSGADQKRLTEIFLASSEHEVRFWDMAYKMEEGQDQ